MAPDSGCRNVLDAPTWHLGFRHVPLLLQLQYGFQGKMLLRGCFVGRVSSPLSQVFEDEILDEKIAAEVREAPVVGLWWMLYWQHLLDCITIENKYLP